MGEERFELPSPEETASTARRTNQLSNSPMVPWPVRLITRADQEIVRAVVSPHTFPI